MSKLGLAIRIPSVLLRALEFAISALVLGIFSYYLADITRRSNNSSIPKWEKAAEGMSGVAVIYTAFAVVLTFFLGGITFFAFVAVVLDVCFCGCFIAIAVFTRGGDKSCNGTNNNSPIGTGQHLSCQLQRAVFAVSIAAACLFLISAVLQVALSRHHKKEKRYGPGPSNNYTSGSGKKKFWQRKNNKNNTHRDAELGVLGAGALAEEKHHHNNRNSTIRPSDDTAMSGTTAPVADGYGGPNNKYAEPTIPAQSAGYMPPRKEYAPQTNGVTGVGAQRNDYAPQTTGVTGTGAVPEMDSANRATGGGHYVMHTDQPYAEVHHGGYVHTNPESGPYSTT